MSIYLATQFCRTFSRGNDLITYCSHNPLKILQNKVFIRVRKPRNVFSHALFVSEIRDYFYNFRDNSRYFQSFQKSIDFSPNISIISK